jgi:hypothetical protein
MRQSLATLSFILAALAGTSSAAQDTFPVQDPSVQRAVVWRAAGLRLQVQMNDMAVVMRLPTLGAAVELWSREPGQADPRREADTVLAASDLWIGRIEARLPHARWPTDRAPEIYRREAELTLAHARLDLAYASGSLGSPAPALAQIFMVDGWTRGIGFRDNPFNDTDAEADAALLTMIPRPGRSVGERAAASPPPYLSQGAGASGQRPTPSLQPPAFPGRIAVAGSAITPPDRQGFLAVWAGMGPDEVSAGASGRPDGAPDARYQLNFPAHGRRLKRLDIYSLNDRGDRTGSRWSSWNASYWAIGIQSLSGRLNLAGPVESLDLPTQTLMLSVTSDGSIRPGAAFEIEATYVDGAIASARAVVGTADSAPPSNGHAAVPQGTVNDFNRPPGDPYSGGPSPVVPAVASAVQARWAGLGSDQVSASGSGQPDGAPDSQVRLDLPGESRSIARLDMFTLNERGDRTGSHWSSWHGSYWALGVTVGGARINPSGPVDRLNAPARSLVLYATSDGSLRDGARIEVEVTLDDGTVRSGTFTVGQVFADVPPEPERDSARGAGAQALQATWAGLGSDEVSPNASGRPDGVPDGQVRVEFAASGRFLSRLDIYGLNEQGARTSTHWSSWNRTYWILGIRARATRLNPNGMVDPLNFPAQPLTLFITDDSSLRPGRRFEVEATFADGSTSTGQFVIPF